MRSIEEIALEKKCLNEIASAAKSLASDHSVRNDPRLWAIRHATQVLLGHVDELIEEFAEEVSRKTRRPVSA